MGYTEVDLHCVPSVRCLSNCKESRCFYRNVEVYEAASAGAKSTDLKYFHICKNYFNAGLIY